MCRKMPSLMTRTIASHQSIGMDHQWSGERSSVARSATSGQDTSMSSRHLLDMATSGATTFSPVKGRSLFVLALLRSASTKLCSEQTVKAGLCEMRPVHIEDTNDIRMSFAFLRVCSMQPHFLKRSFGSRHINTESSRKTKKHSWRKYAQLEVIWLFGLFTFVPFLVYQSTT